MISALPVIPTVACSVIPGLSTACGAAGGITSSVLGAGAGDVLGALAAGVAQGASWLLGQIGSVISSSTTIDLGASWFRSHYEVMVGLAAVVMVPLLLVSVIQSIYRQSPSALLRSALVHLPLALLFGAVAVQLVQLGLAATDALSVAVSSGSSGDVGTTLTSLAASLANQAAGGGPGVPTFVALLGALFVSFGALVVWIELLVRSAAVYVATLFFPLALASLVWPAISPWCRRLIETLATLVLSKFVIVAVLGLALGALGSSDGTMSSELAGGALLMLAAFAPFSLLRLVPFAEASAAHRARGDTSPGPTGGHGRRAVGHLVRPRPRPGCAASGAGRRDRVCARARSARVRRRSGERRTAGARGGRSAGRAHVARVERERLADSGAPRRWSLRYAAALGRPGPRRPASPRLGGHPCPRTRRPRSGAQVAAGRAPPEGRAR